MKNLNHQLNLVKKIKQVEQQLQAHEKQLNQHKQSLYLLFQKNSLLLSATFISILFITWKIDKTYQMRHFLKRSFKLFWLTQF